MIKHDLVENPLFVRPGDFILVQTKETFNLPNDIAAQFLMKSSQARTGLNCLNAGLGDPGWNGSVYTIAMKNEAQYHEFILKVGMKIGQVQFTRVKPVPKDSSYAVKGQYNNTTEATPSRGIR
jgi:dCTP deaminase